MFCDPSFDFDADSSTGLRRFFNRLQHDYDFSAKIVHTCVGMMLGVMAVSHFGQEISKHDKIVVSIVNAVTFGVGILYCYVMAWAYSLAPSSKVREFLKSCLFWF